jgi:hypothetical protein
MDACPAICSAHCPAQQEEAAFSPGLPALQAFTQSLPQVSPQPDATAVLSLSFSPVLLLRLHDIAILPLQHAALSFPVHDAESLPLADAILSQHGHAFAAGTVLC